MLLRTTITFILIFATYPTVSVGGEPEDVSDGTIIVRQGLPAHYILSRQFAVMDEKQKKILRGIDKEFDERMKSPDGLKKINKKIKQWIDNEETLSETGYSFLVFVALLEWCSEHEMITVKTAVREN